MAGEQVAGGRVEHRSPAERQHAVVGGERLGDRLALQVAEVRLAGVHEDVGDRAPLERLDVGVGVARSDAPGVGQQRADGGLAGAHRADEHDREPVTVNLSVSR